MGLLAVVNVHECASINLLRGLSSPDDVAAVVGVWSGLSGP